MKIAFPGMGYMYIPMKILLDSLNLDYILPSKEKKVLEKGILHSPGQVCLPFKVLLGEYINSMEKGADCILSGGSCGHCRQGYYFELHKSILNRIGFKFKFIYLNYTELYPKKLVLAFNEAGIKINLMQASNALFKAVNSICMVERLYRLAKFKACREDRQSNLESNKILNNYHDEIAISKGYANFKKITKKHMDLIDRIEQGSRVKPLKVIIIGDIYACNHDLINFNIESKLSEMNVEVRNMLSIKPWIIEGVLNGILPSMLKPVSYKNGRKIFNVETFGGHGLQNAGYVLSNKNKYDGIVHLYPFSCTPEIIAKSSFATIKEKGIPLISLPLDEHTSEEGFVTRLEAFVDMMQFNK